MSCWLLNSHWLLELKRNVTSKVTEEVSISEYQIYVTYFKLSGGGD